MEGITYAQKQSRSETFADDTSDINMYQERPQIPKKMGRIYETLCKDKWPPMQPGENCCDPDRW